MSLLEKLVRSQLSSMCTSQYGLFRKPFLFSIGHPLQTQSIYMLTIPSQVFIGGFDNPMLAIGTDQNPAQAFKKCLYESIERYSMSLERTKPLCVDLDYKAVKNKFYTTSPQQIPLYVEEQQLRSDFNWQPYKEDSKIEWIIVKHAWLKKKSIIPKSFVSNSFSDKDRIEDKALAFVSSNGCAFHFNYTDAKLAALCELIERHQFLLHWKTFSAGEEIIIDTYLYTLFPELKDLDPDFVTKIRLHSMTFENQWPVVIASFWGDGKSTPAFIVSGSSHADPLVCLKKAINELLICLIGLQKEGSSAVETNYQRLHSDSPNKSVVSFHDRMFYYYRKEQAKSVQFFKDFKKKISFKAWKNKFKTHKSSKIAYVYLVKIFELKKIDLYYHEMRNTATKKINAHVVRAIVPEFIPLDYFHMARTYLPPRYINFQKQGLNELPHPYP